jgi:XTP/dITP diphosphohydrolase
MAQKTQAATTALAELVTIVDRLRDPAGGCPWDLEQTHRSLIPYVLEEAHEVADAIRHGDPEQLQDELGDLLLQVVLHARIASEAGQFDLAAIARSISAKMVRRHPHVFAGAEAADSAAVRRSWEAIKAEERAQRQRRAISTTPMTGDVDTGATTHPPNIDDAQKDGSASGDESSDGNDEGLDDSRRNANQAANALTSNAAKSSGTDGSDTGNGDNLVPPLSPLSDRLASKVRGQPALAAAMTISRQAAAAGFEWDDLDGVWAKVHEELDELKEAVAQAWSEGWINGAGSDQAPSGSDSTARAHAETELGDLLFTLVNVGRWCRLDPEEGLAGTNRRFLDRFSRLEAALGGDLGGRSIQELEALWQQAKAAIRAEQAQSAEL